MDLPKIKGETARNFPLSKLNTWKIGGTAEQVVWPADAEDFETIVNWSIQNRIAFHILGHGSNVLLPDGTLDGLIIVTRNMQNIIWEENRIIAAAGYPLMRLAREAAEKGLSGLEFASGIPGTVGGAIIMNAGAHGSCMEKVIRRVRFITVQGEIREYRKEDIAFSYRKTSLADSGGWVLEVTLELAKDDPGLIKRRIKEYSEKRKAVQPLEYPNAGSVFKNPSGESAGRLIEQTGLKGYEQGGAQVSLKHANFIVNKGNASAGDVLTLIRFIQESVYEKYGIWLETEVELISANSYQEGIPADGSLCHNWKTKT